jgi:hypothetical protein
MAPRHTLLNAILASALCACIGTASAAVTFIGEGSIPGTATDQSGLSGLLEDGVTPKNLVGGFGSAITYSGKDNLYVATPDRGPADGATTYIDRIYTIRIALKKIGANQFEVKPSVISTKLMRLDGHDYFTGFSAAFDETGSTESLRFDPEGVRLSRCGKTAFVSDEYGPYLYEFDLHSGKRLRSLNLPNKYLIDIPFPTPASGTNLELVHNAFGRQANRGMEGLAISPDGSKLYGIMQSALLQDGALTGTSREGTNNRIVEIDIDSGEVREFLYQLASKSNGVSEILAINDHEFLVLERDGKAGSEATFKKLFKIDISGATDIRGVKQLPQTGLPPSPPAVTPVAKSVFLDLLSSEFGLAGASFPEKIEGLAFGPDLDDGRHLLIVTNDNDFVQAQPSRFFAFAIDPAGFNYQPQQFSKKGGSKCKSDNDDD